MSIFKEPSEEKSEKSIENIFKIIAIGVLIILFTILFFNYENIQSSVKTNFLSKSIQKEMFSYLRSVQSLEDDFYKISNHYINHKNQTYSIEQLDKDIKNIDDLMDKLGEIDCEECMLENKILFLQEILAVRDYLVHKKWIFQHEDNFLKDGSDLTKYMAVGKMRRSVLKKVFDQYHVVYLELDHRIKYQVRP